MVQPFDYSIRSTAQGPLQALSQGMQLGQQFAQIAEAREAARLKDEERQLAIEQQTRMNTALNNFRTKFGSGTLNSEDVANVVLANPGLKSLGDNMKTVFDMFSADRQNNEKKFIGQTYTALLANPQQAAAMLQERAEASRESDPGSARFYEMLAQVAPVNATLVAEALLPLGNTIFGKEWTDGVLNVRKAIMPDPNAQLLREKLAAEIAKLKSEGKNEEAKAALAAAQALQVGRPDPTTQVKNYEFWKGLSLEQRKDFESVLRSSQQQTTIDLSGLIDKGGASEIAKLLPIEREKVIGTANAISNLPRYRQALGQAIVGPLAEQRAFVARVLGFAPDQLEATQRFVQGMAQNVLESRSMLRGQGAISNYEQQVLEKAVSADINLSRVELQALLDVYERAAKINYQRSFQFIQEASNLSGGGGAAGLFLRTLPKVDIGPLPPLNMGPGRPSAPTRQTTTTTLPTPADQNAPLPAGGARAAPAAGGSSGAPMTTVPAPGAGGRARTVDEILQQYRSRQ